MRRRALIAALVSLNIGYPVQARELASHAGLVASISGEEWCKEAIDIKVSAPASNVFTGDKVTLQRLLGGVRAMLGFECPEANAIRVTGLVDGATIYKGIVSEAAQWTLVDIHLRDHTTPDPEIPTPSQTTSTPAETEKSAIAPKLTDSTSHISTLAKDTKEAITTCKNLVDSAKSLTDYSGPIAACREALKAAPNSAEVHGLLGKAYFSNNQQTQAIPHLKIAAKAGGSESRALWGLSVIATETDRDKRSRGMDLLKAASNDGVVGASLALGLFYMGELPPNVSSVVTIDLGEARKYLHLAKAQNDDTESKSKSKVIQKALDALQRAERDSSPKISQTVARSVDEGETRSVVTGGKNSFDISGVDAQVTALKFFEGSGQELQPYDQRIYANQFNQSASRYIFWELNLQHSSPHRRVDIEIVAQLSDSSGHLGSRERLNSYIDPGWTTSYHNYGWGWETPGNWQAGDYRFDLFVGTNKVASGEFSIQNDSAIRSAPPERAGVNDADKRLCEFINNRAPYPTTPESRNGRIAGRIASRNQDVHDACQRLVSSSPTNARYRFLNARANYLINGGNLGQAERDARWAADNGYSSAYWILAGLILDGPVCGYKQAAVAIDYLEKAAAGGDKDALFILGSIHSRKRFCGRKDRYARWQFGWPEDFEKARRYYLKAKESGFDDQYQNKYRSAQTELERLDTTIGERKLLSEQARDGRQRLDRIRSEYDMTGREEAQKDIIASIVRGKNIKYVSKLDDNSLKSIIGSYVGLPEMLEIVIRFHDHIGPKNNRRRTLASIELDRMQSGGYLDAATDREAFVTEKGASLVKNARKAFIYPGTIPRYYQGSIVWRSHFVRSVDIAERMTDKEKGTAKVRYVFNIEKLPILDYVRAIAEEDLSSEIYRATAQFSGEFEVTLKKWDEGWRVESGKRIK